jgi:release factor glutamine methyltransferase
MGRVFACDKRALIPRPETEELVAAVAALAKAWPAPSPPRLRIVDVGTGTGCIAITLALELPEAELIATDISADALALACGNAAAHGLEYSVRTATGDGMKPELQRRLGFMESDLLAGIEPAGVDIVVSNPPYIADGDASSLAPEIREHEPRAALFAGPDGLAVIRRLVGQAAAVLRPGGWLLLEIGETQAVAVQSSLAGAGFRDVCARKDLAGHDRMVQGRRPLL